MTVVKAVIVIIPHLVYLGIMLHTIFTCPVPGVALLLWSIGIGFAVLILSPLRPLPKIGNTALLAVGMLFKVLEVTASVSIEAVDSGAKFLSRVRRLLKVGWLVFGSLLIAILICIGVLSAAISMH